MKELLLKRKWGFTKYLIGCLCPIVDQFMNLFVFALIFESISQNDMMLYKKTVMVVIAAIVLTMTLSLVSRLMRITFMRDILQDIRNKAFDKVIGMSYKGFSKTSKEVYLSHLVNDINTFETNFFMNFYQGVSLAGTFAISALILMIVNFKLGVVTLITSIVIFYVGRLFSKKTDAYQEEVSTENEQFTVEVSNTFNGLEILKLNNIEDVFLKKSFKAIDGVEKKKLKLTVFSELQRDLTMTLSFAAMIGILIYMLLVREPGQSFTMAMLVFQLSLNVIFQLKELIPRVNMVKASLKIFNKITQGTKDEVEGNQNKRELKFEKQIEVRDLSFSYESIPILEHANFTIEKGKKYLIKGISGSGKSTLIKLLSMIYDNYEGQILIDGVDYREVDETSFNQKTSYIYQDVFLFEDTIFNNVSLFKKMSEEVIERACDLAGLQDVLEADEAGLYKVLEENGKNLSGGQRQRISIARAIAKEADLLFVDEATSALNEEIGRRIEQVLQSLECTVVAISHRYYEGITNQYDYVLEVRNGKVYTFDAKDYFEEVAVC